MRVSRVFVSALVLVLALAFAGTAVAQQPLFEDLGFDRPTSKAAQFTHEVRIADGLLTAEAAQLHISFFDGKLHRVMRESVVDRGEGNLLWKGRFADGGQAILTRHNGIVAGLLYGPDGVWEISTAEHGGQTLSKIDQEAFPGCASELDVPQNQRDYLKAGFERAARAPIRVSDAKATTLIDVMSVWTPQAQNGAGGVNQIQATIQSAVDVSNTAFANSGADVAFNLVHMQAVNYNDSGDIFTDRNWLRDDPTVNGLRDQYGADLVSMIVENSAYCGVAFLMGNEDPAGFSENGYQITVRPCAVGNLSFPHEHGHNLGLQHNPENGDVVSNTVYPWSYGHYVNGNYRTVMSYSNPCSQGCTRQPYFSNPDVTFQGAPTGIADQRDNERTISLVAPFTAEYRPTGGTGTAPFTLSADGYKRRGRINVDLTWAGATTSNVDIYRDGSLITTTTNDGAYTDATGQRRGTFTYQVCEAGSSTCSNTATN